MLAAEGPGAGAPEKSPVMPVVRWSGDRSDRTMNGTNAKRMLARKSGEASKMKQLVANSRGRRCAPGLAVLVAQSTPRQDQEVVAFGHVRRSEWDDGSHIAMCGQGQGRNDRRR